MLRRSAVDTVVTQPGSFPFDTVVKAYPALRQLIWVVDDGTKHMDWNEVPEGMGGSVNVATWQDIVNDAPESAGAELPPLDPANTPQDVVAFWQSKAGDMGEMTRFTQANLVAGIAGQLASLPVKDRMTAADLFLPADSLVHIHTLTLTLAALYSNASVAFNSVAAHSPDLVLATQGIAPTILVASPQTLLKTHEESIGKLTSSLAKASHSLATRILTQDGVFNPSNILSAFSSSSRPPIGTNPGKLRAVYVAERAGAGTPRLSSGVLSDLRIFTGARVVYALSAPKVAGAVSQTAFLDYRTGDKGHFGAPVTSVEVFLKDSGEVKTTDENIEGEVSSIILLYVHTFFPSHHWRSFPLESQWRCANVLSRYSCAVRLLLVVKPVLAPPARFRMIIPLLTLLEDIYPFERKLTVYETNLRIKRMLLLLCKYSNTFCSLSVDFVKNPYCEPLFTCSTSSHTKIHRQTAMIMVPRDPNKKLGQGRVLQYVCRDPRW